MDFAYSTEQEAWRATLRQFLAQHAPVSEARRLATAGTAHDETLWRRMGDLGLHGIHIADRWGGQGFGVEELAIAAEEMGRVLVCSPFVASTVLAATALQSAASAGSAGAAEMLSTVATGERIATMAMWEQDRDWEPFGGGVLATSGPDGTVTARGEKIAVPFGSSADVVLVTAERDGVPVLVTVDGAAARSADVATLDLTTRLATLTLTDTPVRVLAEGPVAQAAVEAAIHHGHVMLAAEMVGGAQACLEAAVAYARQRHQFGRPIGSFQAVKHLCADMLAEVELARSASLYATWALHARDDSARRAASMAKALASDAYLIVADASLHVHGGMGFTWEHDAHLYLRRARSASLLLGDADHHGDLFLRLTDNKVIAEALAAATTKGAA